MSNRVILHAISAVLALGLNSVASAQEMGTIDGMEKCYGVSKAGMNDCGTASHACGGESKADRDPEAWIAVPTGLCQRIAGGTTKALDKS